MRPVAAPATVESAFLGAPGIDGLVPTRSPRVALWVLLVVLVLAADCILLLMTLQYRASRTQDNVEQSTAAASAELHRTLGLDLERVMRLPDASAANASWQQQASALLESHPEIRRIERREAGMALTAAVDSRLHVPTFSHTGRDQMHVETDVACSTSSSRSGPSYSNAYFVPLGEGAGSGARVMDLCVVDLNENRRTGFLVVSYDLPALLDMVGASGASGDNDVILVEPDGSRVAHGSLHAGAGVFMADRMLDLPGAAIQIQLESPSSRPRLVPDLLTVFIASLSLGLIGVVAALVVDMRRRARAEAALADALSFRKAMDDSLVTGLRARDLQRRITYANPAFCAMVGFPAKEVVGTDTPPYWPPEQQEAYRERRSSRLEARGRTTFETVFMRNNGERFPAMVFEAPLIGASGRHTGWVSAVVDLSAQRRVEEVARQQQERLQGTARLATAGEMASLLSHELTQPVSAISAYAIGTLNMLADASKSGVFDAELRSMLYEGLEQIADQARHAGRVIKSVHNFVRRREGAREPITVGELFEAVLPMIKLQARKGHARVEIDIVDGPLPNVVCDRVMVEQVLLNLSRNGLQAMQSSASDRPRLLSIRARRSSPRSVRIEVRDCGEGLADDVAAKLFTAFFTTRRDGMGLGLSVCRTIVEQHGGMLTFSNVRNEHDRISGAEFAFDLPVLPQTSGAVCDRPEDDSMERMDDAGTRLAERSR